MDIADGIIIDLSVLLFLSLVSLIGRNADNAFEDRAKAMGFTISEISKIDGNALIYKANNESVFLQKAKELNVTTIYKDMTMLNGLYYVVMNATVGWNYVP